MSNPFTDPRAQQMLAAKCDQITALASQFNSVSNTSTLVAGALTEADDEKSWTGDAADAFRSVLGQLPPNLKSVAEAYFEVSLSMNAYGSQLEPVQKAFLNLQLRYEAATKALAKAQTAADAANQQLTIALANPYLPHPVAPFTPINPYLLTHNPQAAPGISGVDGQIGLNGVWYPKPVPPIPSAEQSLGAAQQAAWRAGATVSGIEEEIQELCAQGTVLLNEFEELLSRVLATVKQATNEAPLEVKELPHGSRLNWHTIKDLGKDVGKAAWHLPGDYLNVMEHPLDPKAWADYGKDVGTVGGAVAMAAAIAACPADALGVEGAADFLAGVAGVGDAVATVGTSGKTLGDLGSLVDGKGNLNTVLGDAETLGIGALTDQLGKGAEEDVDGLKDTQAGVGKAGINVAKGNNILKGLTADEQASLAKALDKDSDGISQYSLNKALGQNSHDAYGNLSASQRAQLNDAVERLSDPKELSGMQSQVEKNLADAQKHARQVTEKKIVAGWLNDQAKDHLLDSEHGHGKDGGGK